MGNGIHFYYADELSARWSPLEVMRRKRTNEVTRIHAVDPVLFCGIALISFMVGILTYLQVSEVKFFTLTSVY